MASTASPAPSTRAATASPRPAEWFAAGLARHSRQALAVTALAGVSAFGLISGAANASDSDPAPVDAAKAITSVSSFDALAERQAVADDASRSQRSTPVKTTTTKPVTTPTRKPVAAPKPVKAAPKPPAAAPRPAWLIPMKGAQVTSCFGQRWGVLHAGIDFAMPSGTPIRAVGAGTVVSAGWAYSGYGISVVVDHHNGYLTHYAHMSQDKVSIGDEVKMGRSSGPTTEFSNRKMPLRLAKGPQLAGFDVGGSVSAETFPARSRFWAICLCAGESRFPAGPSSAARGSH